MRLLFIAAEAAPLMKVGGLADVAGALPRQLRHAGVDAALVMPLVSQNARYRGGTYAHYGRIFGAR
jgi:starch synthase